MSLTSARMMYSRIVRKVAPAFRKRQIGPPIEPQAATNGAMDDAAIIEPQEPRVFQQRADRAVWNIGRRTAQNIIVVGLLRTGDALPDRRHVEVRDV